MTAPPWLGTAQDATLCNFGTTGAAFAASAAWASAYTGQIWGTVGFGAVSAALAAGSAAYGCYTGEPEQPTNEYSKICCAVWSNSTADVYWYDDEGNRNGTGYFPSNVAKLVSVKIVPGGQLPIGPPSSYAAFDFVTDKYNNGDETTYRGAAPAEWATTGCFSLDSASGGCVAQGPDIEPPKPGPPDPITYTDPETGCTWNTTMFDAYLNAQGNVVIGYVATSADPDVCGGPIYWWEEAGKPPRIVQPYPDPPNPPDPPVPPPEPLPCCDDIKQKLDELLDCACKPDRPELFRHWRSIRFESDEYTPNGKRRLSKLFRYRGSSPGDVGRVADHWKDFRWVTGSTVVIHKGSPVGTPQVWARDADEGKRVIRHAFLEAGTDADSVGEWIVTGPSGSRTGVSLEVGLLCVDGCWSATARSGSAGWPEAAVVTPEPYGSGQ